MDDKYADTAMPEHRTMIEAPVSRVWMLVMGREKGGEIDKGRVLFGTRAIFRS